MDTPSNDASLLTSEQVIAALRRMKESRVVFRASDIDAAIVLIQSYESRLRNLGVIPPSTTESSNEA